MTTPTKSVSVRRTEYNNELLASGSVTPVLYDDPYDGYQNLDVLDATLKYNPLIVLNGYGWDGLQQVPIGGGVVDTTAPTVTITCTQTSPTATTPLSMTITFSEAVVGFVVGDITISGGSLAGFATADNIVFTVSWTPATGANTMDIAAGVCKDAAGNDNTAATQFAITYSGLIGNWLMNDASGTVAVDSSVFGNNGTYNGVTLNQAITDGTGRKFTCPYWGGNGSHDYMHFYSTGLVSRLNMDKFSIASWLRVEDAGVWTDGFFHDWVVINVDSVNQFFIRKQSVNNRVYGLRTAQSDVHQIQLDGLSNTDWFHWCVTGSVASDTFSIYVNGVFVVEFFQYSGNELWTGVIPSNTCLLGASVADPSISTHEWKGWFARLKIYNYVLSQDEITALAAETET